MAEAVTEERSAGPMRYFCHKCKVDINIPNADFTCPLCAGGFIEELPTARNEMRSGGSNASVNRSTLGGSGNSNRRDERLSEWNALRDDLTTLIMSRNASNFEISFGNDGSRRISITGGGGNDDQISGGGVTSNNESGTNRSERLSNVGSGRIRAHNFDRFDNVLLDFLQTLTLNEVDGPFGGSQFIFMGNPGDYAWGREGIDTIVTQLLNQMDTSGPPPLSKEKIDEIPIVQVNSEDIKNKLQCSVCWEDFKVEESVRRLPCAHIYHESCIIPWLNLHNTCPICRKSLADETAETEQSLETSPRATVSDGENITLTQTGGHSNSVRIPFLASLQTAMQQQQQTTNHRNHSNNRGGTNGTNASTNASSQDNVFGFENSNHDLDMDLD